MSALVFGATGYVGGHLVRIGCESGGTLIAHIRPDSASGDSRAQAFAALGAQVERTPWIADAIRDMLVRVRPTVIHLLLGTTAARARAAAARGVTATQQTVDHALTMMVIDAARDVCPATGLVYLSSLGASAGGNVYLQVRASIEARLLAGPNPFTVLRPSLITGADRGESRTGERLGAVAADTLAFLLRAAGSTAMSARYRSITGEALARILWSVGVAPLDGQTHDLSRYRDA